MIQIQLRRGTASEWSTNNPILASGELGVETDTNKTKIGNGTDFWSALQYSVSSSAWGDIQGDILNQSDLQLALNDNLKSNNDTSIINALIFG